MDSPCCRHTFLSLYDQSKNYDFKGTFIDEMIELAGNQPYILARLYQSLAQQPYAAAFIIHMIKRENYKKLGDYKIFGKAVETADLIQLNQMAESQEERLLQFIRFVMIQDKHSDMYNEGQKAIAQAMKLDKMQGYKDQSFHIMDCESNVIEEENIKMDISEEKGIKRGHATVNMNTLHDLLGAGKSEDIK